MLLVKKDTFALETTSRLVKAADVAVVAQVDEVMKAARDEGYEKGLQDGKMEITMQKLDLLESSVQYMESVEEKMCGIVLKALRKCVDEIGDEELVVQVTKKAMRAVVRNQQQITVRVNDRMAPVVKARMQEILEDAPTRLFAFENVSSPGITTSESFKSLMTTYRPEYQDSIPFYTCQTLIQVMREAGYRSIWVSNQSKRGFSDNVVGNFADLSDTTFFNGDELSGMNRKSPDEELLPVINRITEENKTGKYFYVIHLMGSHPAFRDRYPEAFDIFKEADYPDRIESQRPFFATYDNSLLYTDYIISRIFEAFKEKEAVIIYLSDHGLDFFMSYDDYCAHAVSSSSPSARFAREVPFLIYTSDTYREHFPTVCERIRMSTDREYRTDSLIYTVMDFAGVVFRDSTACGGSILQADSCR